MKATGTVRAYYSTLGRMRMLGGAPALDFANTLHWREGALADFVPDYASLVRFCVPAGLLSAAEAKAALAAAASAPRRAKATHDACLRLRDGLKAWLGGTAANLKASQAKRRAVQSTFAAQLSAASEAFSLADILAARTAAGADEGLALPLRRIAGACALLLLYPPEGDIRQCEADHCGGFFINQSRSKPRRWCSMDGCGNRAKAARFRHAHG
jgi:predicted RNA-binding Zn ribbon-like protein